MVDTYVLFSFLINLSSKIKNNFKCELISEIGFKCFLVKK